MKVKISSPLKIIIIINILSIFVIAFWFNTFIGGISRIVFLSSGLLIVFGLQTRSESKDLLKFKKESYDSLYHWTNDLSGGHLLVNKLLFDLEVKEDILVNLKNIRSKIMIYANHDINNLRLLKAYFNVIKEEKEKETYFKVVISFLAGIILFYLRTPQAISSNVFLKKLVIFSPLELLLSLIIFLAFFINITYLGNKRIRIVESVIEECINEKK